MHTRAADDPQVRHMKAIATYEHPMAGTVRVAAPTFKMSGTPGSIDRPAPRIDEHTREVLAECGFGERDIGNFLEKGSVSQAEEAPAMGQGRARASAGSAGDGGRRPVSRPRWPRRRRVPRCREWHAVPRCRCRPH